MMAHGPLERASFRHIKEEILRRVTRGEWGPGTLLPGEIELAAEFGCSRATVNRSLRELSEAGLLERRRKAGTRVRLTPVRQARFEIPLIREEIEAGGAAYRYTLLQRTLAPVPAAMRKLFHASPRARLLHLLCRHDADGVPYQLEDRWINLAALPQAGTADFSSLGPNEWLVREVPYSQVEISFLAEAAGPAACAHLGYASGEPVFTTERTTWWEGRALTHVRLAYRRGHRMTARY